MKSDYKKLLDALAQLDRERNKTKQLIETCKDLLRVVDIARKRLGLDFECPAQERAHTTLANVEGK